MEFFFTSSLFEKMPVNRAQTSERSVGMFLKNEYSEEDRLTFQ
jgi:hypothetical protein